MLEKEPMKLTTKNLYSYCDNNPVSKYDSNGESAIAVISAFTIKYAPRIIGALVGMGSYVVSTLIQGEKVRPEGVAVALVSGASFNLFFSATIDAAYEGYVTMINNKSASSADVFNSAFLTFGLSMINLKDITALRNIIGLEKVSLTNDYLNLMRIYNIQHGM